MKSKEAMEQTIGYDLSKVKIIQELITTETNYNQAMRLLEAVFADDKLTQAQELCTQFKLIIRALSVISEKLIANIKTGIDEEMTAEERLNHVKSRAQLINAFCKAYQTYPQLYLEFTALGKDGGAQFKEMDISIRRTTGQKHGLSDLLSQPFQRGPRYLMLIKEALKSIKDLPDDYIQELKRLEICLSEAIALSNASMPVVQKPEPVVSSRSSLPFFGSRNNTNTPPNQQGYQFGDWTRAAINYWHKKEPLAVVESSDVDGPPTDLPPELPPELLLAELDLPPTDLPPELPTNLHTGLNVGHEEQISDEDGEDNDFDSNHFTLQ